MCLMRYLKSEYVNNSLKLISGTLIAQIIPFIFYPILGRLFPPAEFTVLANFTAIVSIISVMVSGQYRQVILIARTEEIATNIFSLCFILTVLGSIFFTIILFLCKDLYIDIPSLYGIIDIIYLVPLSVISLNVFELYNEWCVRHKYFMNLSFNKIVNAAALSTIKTGYGFGNIQTGLVWGDVLGKIVSALFCIAGMLKRHFKIREVVSWKKMIYAATRYKECPLNLMPAQLMNTVGGQAPVLILSAYFLADNVGQFTMAYSIMALPSIVVSAAVRDVFRQKANEAYVKNGHCKEVYISTMKTVTFLSLVGYSILALISPWLFTFFLGDNWELAGIYARLLCPMVAINFVSEVGSGMFVISEHIKEGMWWQFAYVVLSILSLWLSAILFNDIVITILCFTLIRSVLYLVNFRLTYQYSKGL